MSRQNKILVSAFLLLLALLTYLEASEPEPVNWSPSYTSRDKIPLGSFVLFESLQDQVPEIQQINIPPYEFLGGEGENGTYFFMNNTLAFDKDEMNRLFSWIEKGNTAFLAAENFNPGLLDSLNLEIGVSVPKMGFSSKPVLNLVNPELKDTTGYPYDRETYNHIFTEIDSLQHTVLGVSRLSSENPESEDPAPNFLQIPFGDGQLFIHTMPNAFSNYFMLSEDNHEYVEKALAYLPKENLLLWDEYYKSGKTFYTTPLYILLSNRELKWAYYLVIAGALIFVLFEGKRKQRSIPVIKPLKNQSVYFARTIAGLYLEKNDHTAIANKKIALFLDYIRNELRIPTEERNEAFYNRLAARVNKKPGEAEELFRYIDRLQNKQTITEEELLRLNSAINSFKTTKDGKRPDKQ